MDTSAVVLVCGFSRKRRKLISSETDSSGYENGFIFQVQVSHTTRSKGHIFSKFRLQYEMSLFK